MSTVNETTSRNSKRLPKALWGTMKVGEEGHLWIGGCDTVNLAERYGTPLFVYDEAHIRSSIRAFKQAFEQSGVAYEIAYAAKAFCTVAMCQLVNEEGMSLDVVSGGELYTALAAQVPPEKIHMHGNNKTEAEIRFGIEQSIGLFVVDNFLELSRIQALAAEAGKTVDVVLRVAPGVEAHTHEFISTGQQDSKFGFDMQSGQAVSAMESVRGMPNLRCVGLHCHIGSQIFETGGFAAAARTMSRLYRTGVELGLPLCVLNLGGGFGIRYTLEDRPVPIHEHVAVVVDTVRACFEEMGIPLPVIWMEPGRSIVGAAGITLYTAGSQKVIPDVRNYVAVDGGMTDNPRYALYGAEYEAALANRMWAPSDERWTVAGKCCESGDVVIWNTALATPRPGDIVAVFSTGAYNYAMVSHYNRIPHPAVVFARDGQSRVVVRRETWADVARLDEPLHG